MTAVSSHKGSVPHIVIIGAGIGGLASALRLSASACRVTVLERHAHPGGKMRPVDTVAGPADAGPTVLTLRDVFADLFASVGERLENHVNLTRQTILARHFWPDGGQLDLFEDHDRSVAAVEAFAGEKEARAFERFNADTRRLFDAFDQPMMRAAVPSPIAAASQVLRQPSLLGLTRPLSTLHKNLQERFADVRLVQLFGRYATYVGGSPYHAPAVLALIWQAEAAGVWTVQGGLHGLARAIADLAQARGVDFRYDCDVARIIRKKGRVCGVTLADGQGIDADLVVFNGDPRALAKGGLGAELAPRAARTARDDRSLSARVWSFAAKYQGPDLVHHNVFFVATPEAEFRALQEGRMPGAQTLYVCAQDRAEPDAPPPRGPERFEIIANAAPLTVGAPPEQEFETCQRQTFRALARFGMSFDPLPGVEALTTPSGFDTLFPHSAGSLYGQSPHGTLASFRRPTARSGTPGLYLAGGGTHPGAGVPMAALSGRHAAEAIMRDHGLTSTCRPTDTPGGMSMASATITAGRSRSSAS